MARFLATLVLLGAASAAGAQSCEAVYPRKITVLNQNAARVDWSRSSHQKIAFDRAERPSRGNRQPYFDVYVMEADGSAERCLTCGMRDTPGLRKHKGNPAWHPSGEYIVFQAETDEEGSPKFANPGRGVRNVLWLTDKEGQWFAQITPTDYEPAPTGALHPHFSEDGGKLSWTEQYASSSPADPGMLAGAWRLMVADFAFVGGRPQLSNVQGYVPMKEGFYENHGFSPDGKRLIFSSNAGRRGLVKRLNNDIFVLDLSNGSVTPQTNANYNEHASYFPSGLTILWMSDRDVPGEGTELWLRDPAAPVGQGERLTWFNQEGCPEYVAERVIVADSSINAAGDKIVAFGQSGLLGDYGVIYLIELERPF